MLCLTLARGSQPAESQCGQHSHQEPSPGARAPHAPSQEAGLKPWVPEGLGCSLCAADTRPQEHQAHSTAGQAEAAKQAETLNPGTTPESEACRVSIFRALEKLQGKAK